MEKIYKHHIHRDHGQYGEGDKKPFSFRHYSPVEVPLLYEQYRAGEDGHGIKKHDVPFFLNHIWYGKGKKHEKVLIMDFGIKEEIDYEGEKNQFPQWHVMEFYVDCKNGDTH